LFIKARYERILNYFLRAVSNFKLQNSTGQGGLQARPPANQTVEERLEESKAKKSTDTKESKKNNERLKATMTLQRCYQYDDGLPQWSLEVSDTLLQGGMDSWRLETLIKVRSGSKNDVEIQNWKLPVPYSPDTRRLPDGSAAAIRFDFSL
jgi:hypothetical protein